MRLNLIKKIILRLNPRYKKIETCFLGFPITMVDKSSFLYMYKEIFERKIYNFIKGEKNKELKIIDCGANIGLSVLYFKIEYPKSKIIAFEPDPEIFQMLKKNIENSNFKDITLINKGLSNTETEISFIPNGSDGGEIDKKNLGKLKIQTEKLSAYLKNEVDFLKIDIEGSEVDVLEECSEYLNNVKNIFVEYHSFKGEEQKLQNLLTILTNNNFKYFIENPLKETESPFINRVVYENIDLQLNLYGYRE